MYVYLTYNVYRYIMDSDFCLRFFILRGWVGWGRVFSPESREYRTWYKASCLTTPTST